MKKIILLFCLLGLVSFSSFAQKSDARYSGDFLNIPAGVRAAGMGGAFVAVADDGSAFNYNPAGIVLVKGFRYSTHYASQFGNISDPLSTYLFNGYSHHFGELGAVSLNWIRLSIDDIKQYGELVGWNADSRYGTIGDLIANGGSFNNNQDAVILNYAVEFRPIIDFGWMFFKVPYRVPVGINLKYIRESFGGKVNYVGSGFGADLGVMVINNVNDYFANKIFGELTYGITLKDFTNTIITWNSVDKRQFKIPFSTAWGLSYRQPLPMINTTALLSYQKSMQYNDITDWGTEFIYDNSYSLRLGRMNSQFTMGIGLYILNGLTVDYAFQIHELGNPHRIGLSINFESFKW